MTAPLITLTVVLDEEPPLLMGHYEPAQIEPLLSLLRAYPLEHPTGQLCHFREVRVCFGANGDRPHMEVLAFSEQHEAGALGALLAAVKAEAVQ